MGRARWVPEKGEVCEFRDEGELDWCVDKFITMNPNRGRDDIPYICQQYSYEEARPYVSQREKDLQAEVERLQDIIHGGCQRLYSPIFSKKDVANWMEAKAEVGLADHPVHKVFNAVFPEGESDGRS